jgi:hypothetical protein
VLPELAPVASRHGAPGAFSVNRAAFELLAALEDAELQLRQLARGDHPDPGYNPALATLYRRQLDRAQLSRDAALTRADARDRAHRIATPAFTLPAWPPPTSLDTREHRRKHKRPRLSEGVKARQRDRYKRAMAEALDAFAHEHRPRRRVDRNRRARPRWLDHLAACREPGSCRGCRRIIAHAAPRWHRTRQGRPRADYLEPVVMLPTDWLKDRAAALRSCREAIALRDAACGGTMILPQSCDVRTCPDCEQARQARVVDRYQAAVAAIPADRARFLTLTVRNVPRGELERGYNHLRDSMEKLRRRAIWRGGRCRDRARCRMPLDPSRPRGGWKLPHPPIAAALLTIEITDNPATRSWHPHAHAILDSAYLDQAELRDTWAAITGDSFVVDIRAVASYATANHAGDTRAALAELLKYAAKPSPSYLSSRDPAPIAELLVTLRGRRMTSATGYLHELDDGTLEPATWPDGRLVRPGPTCSLLVLVASDNPDAEPYRAPRRCPLHGGLADWQLAGYVARQLARKVPARAGPRPRVLALLE